MPVKKTVRKTRAETPKKASKGPARPSPVKIDFPLEGETVRPGHYAIRVSAEASAKVDVSIDGTAWLPCRESVGYFWYDWQPESSGAHRIEARAKVGAVYRRSLVRVCTVASLAPAFG
ncbi:MAG: Ig-like domain-containing protein [Proteobacteria bacterium]|nr:Ig-like domain-containing protein [Pseudomonadota bacterium]